MVANDNVTSPFERIGGAPAVKLAVELFYEKVLADPQLAGYFANVDMAGQRRHLALMLTAILGGPDEYAGRDLATAHKPLNIAGADYAKVGEYLVSTLSELSVPEDIQAAVITVLGQVRDQVVADEEVSAA
jgi:hemoglobin